MKTKLLYIAAIFTVACSKESMEAQIITITPDDTVIITTPATVTIDNTQYTNVDVPSIPIVGQGTVTETITDVSKPDDTEPSFSYYYAIQPEQHWVAKGYTDGAGFGQFLRPNATEIPQSPDRIQAVAFTQMSQSDISGFNVLYTDAYTTTGIKSALDEALGLMDEGFAHDSEHIYLHSADGFAYGFGGLAVGDGIVVADTYGLTNYLLIHEFAHNFQAANFSVDTWSSLQQNHYISDYGTTAVSEYIADAFAYYYTNQPLPQAVVDQIQLELQRYN